VDIQLPRPLHLGIISTVDKVVTRVKTAAINSLLSAATAIPATNGTTNDKIIIIED
jgi:hypothetical protein